jgi:PAS domain S-box-containing protein
VSHLGQAPRLPFGSRVVDDEFWDILKSQPGVGVVLTDTDGRIVYHNDEARRIFYGAERIDALGRTIADLEGPEFAAERMAVLETVLKTGQPHIIRHIRRGRLTESTHWPIQRQIRNKTCVLSIIRQDLSPKAAAPYPVFESRLVDLGPLEGLKRSELEVLILIGHGTPLKTIAKELGVSQRTVERYRTDIARKLKVNSIAEIARLVQRAGLEMRHTDFPRSRAGAVEPPVSTALSDRA